MSTSKELAKHDTLNRFKVIPALEQVKIIEDAVAGILKNQQTIDNCKSAAQQAARDGKTATEKAESNQLSGLRDALAHFPEPITEDAWDKLYRANVAAKFDESGRYKNAASRDVMVNMIKVVTMGLTLAKENYAFKPSDQAKANLKKYADEVRPKLQKTIDPATGKPRLRSIATAPKPPQRLPENHFFWLIGCENADEGMEGANTVICAAIDFRDLQQAMTDFSGDYACFFYCMAELEPLTLEKAKPSLKIQNSAVYSKTISPSSIPHSAQSLVGEG